MPILGASSSGAKPAPTVPTSTSAANAGSGRAYNNGSATVSFSAPTTSKLPVTSYTATSSPGSFTATGASSPLTVTGLQSNTQYVFTVTATSAAGTSSPSAASGIVTATTVPQAPTIGTFTDGGTGTSGTLSFTLNATGGSSITDVTYSTDGVNYTSSGTTTSPLTVTGLSAGSYTFYVKAVNANGTSTASSGVAGTVVTPSSYESIATFTTTGENTATFSSIPSTYKSLQLRMNITGTTSASIYLRINNDATAANYRTASTTSNGDGTAFGNSAQSNGGVGYITLSNRQGLTTNQGFGYIVDLIDYASTGKTKVVKALDGANFGSSGSLEIGFRGGIYNSTSAISSLTILTSGGNFNTGTSIALYGVK